LSKSERYYYDAGSIKEPNTELSLKRHGGPREQPCDDARAKDGPGWKAHRGTLNVNGGFTDGRNKRSVWTVATQAFPEAHFATFPEELITPCVLAGCPIGGTVLDPFSGSGTTGVVALRYHREYIGIELSAEYAAMSERRIRGDAPLFNDGEVTA
ncbi:MAG TPA: site-specific DNA-methyltransferase, partial [Acetobacteraceae bacterium]|nr:site-specific DNA-methyltransferase [Acetobacteraceae bacterium]